LIENYCICTGNQSISTDSHGKNGFLTATKLGTTKEIFVAATKILPQQPNVLLIEPYILLLSQNIFDIPILTNDFVGITKPFFSCKFSVLILTRGGRDFCFPSRPFQMGRHRSVFGSF